MFFKCLGGYSIRNSQSLIDARCISVEIYAGGSYDKISSGNCVEPMNYYNLSTQYSDLHPEEAKISVSLISKKYNV